MDQFSIDMVSESAKKVRKVLLPSCPPLKSKMVLLEVNVGHMPFIFNVKREGDWLMSPKGCAKDNSVTSCNLLLTISWPQSIAARLNGGNLL